MAIILSRLFLAFSLTLFGALQTGSDGLAANVSPAVVNETAPYSAILTAQNQLLRGQLPQDDAPDATLPATANPRPTVSVTVAVSLEQAAPLSPYAFDILPPVRGPPAV